MSSRKNKIYLYLLSVCFIAMGIYLRWKFLGNVDLNEWAMRDFDRAVHLFDNDYFPLAGSEANNGGRLPGPFLYILLNIPLFFDYSYESIINFNFILNIFCLLIIFFSTKKHFGLMAGIIASALLSINITHLGAVQTPMNPTFIFFFIVLFFHFLLEFAYSRNPKNIPWLI